MEDTLLDVTGMSCPSCVRHISAKLHALEGVTKVQVRFQEKRVLVTHETEATPVAALVEALQDAGYASKPAAA
jgi:copper chaperone CopZ